MFPTTYGHPPISVVVRRRTARTQREHSPSSFEVIVLGRIVLLECVEEPLDRVRMLDVASRPLHVLTQYLTRRINRFDGLFECGHEREAFPLLIPRGESCLEPIALLDERLWLLFIRRAP